MIDCQIYEIDNKFYYKIFYDNEEIKSELYDAEFLCKDELSKYIDKIIIK